MTDKISQERKNFLKIVWSPHPIGSYVFIGSKGEGRDTKFNEFAFEKSGNYLEQVIQRIAIEDGKNRNIFYSINSSCKPERKIGFIDDTPYLHADLDNVDLSLLPLKPNILVQTSKHCHQCLMELEKPVPPRDAEKLSSRLTKGVGADPAGMTATKYFRMPNTTNHKEGRNEFKVKFVSRREKRYKKRIVKRALKKILPQLKEKHESSEEVERSDLAEIEINLGCEKNVKSVFNLLKESVAGKKIQIVKKLCTAESGKRSEAIWQMINMLLDDNVEIENIACIIFNSDAFKSKHGERKKRLVGEIQRALSKRSISKTDHKIRCINEIKSLIPEYLWYPYLPKAMLVMFDGSPGDGKSLVSAYMAAQLSNGLNIFNGAENHEKCVILLMSAEDHPNYVLRPRLEAMGANLQNIYFVDEMFTLDKNGLVLMENHLKENRPALVVIDPLFNFMNGIDTYRTDDVAHFIGKMRELADTYEATILCIRHLNKTYSGPVTNAGQGAVGIIGGARSGMMLIPDKEFPESKRNLLHIKSNIGPKGRPIKFEIYSDNDRSPPKITFIEEMDCSNDDLLNPSDDDDKKPVSMKSKAIEFLRYYLLRGPASNSSIKMKAESLGITEKPLRDARQYLKLIVVKDSDGTTTWQLP